MSLTKTIGEVGSYLRRTVPDLFNPVTSLVYRIYKVASAGANGNTISGSLTEISKSARVEPFTIISSDLMVGQDYMHDVLDSVLSVFSAYYLQAIALDTEIEGVKVGKYLDKFSPSRSADGTDVLDTAITGGVSTAFTLGLIDSKGSSSTEAFMHPYELEVDPPYLQTKNYFFSLPFRSNAITLEATAVSLEANGKRDKAIAFVKDRIKNSVASYLYIDDDKLKAQVVEKFNKLVNDNPGVFKDIVNDKGLTLDQKKNVIDAMIKDNVPRAVNAVNSDKFISDNAFNQYVKENLENIKYYFKTREQTETTPPPEAPSAPEVTSTPEVGSASAASSTATPNNNNNQQTQPGATTPNNNNSQQTQPNTATSNTNNNQQAQPTDEERLEAELGALKEVAKADAYRQYKDDRIYRNANIDEVIDKYMHDKDFQEKIEHLTKGFNRETKAQIVRDTICNLMPHMLATTNKKGDNEIIITDARFDAAIHRAIKAADQKIPSPVLDSAFRLPSDIYSKMRPDGLSKTAVDNANKKMFDKFLNMSDSERKEFFTAMSKNLNKERKINDFSDIGKDIRYTPIYKESEINTYKEHVDLLEASRKKIEDNLIGLQSSLSSGYITDRGIDGKLISRPITDAERKQIEGLIETRKMQLNHQMGLIKNANDSIRYMASVNAQAKQNAMKVVQASQAKRIEEAIKNEYNQQTINDQGLQEIKDSSNQVVGKLLNVSINIQGRKVTIPVTVRLIAVPATPERVGSIMAGKSLDQSFGARWKRWRAGRIEFFKDLILCQDLIDEHKKRLMEDDGGVLMAIEKRKSAQTKASLANNELSIADATNIFIISREVEKIIEKTLGGKLSSAITRNKIFNQTYGMIIVVIDKAYERAVIYTRGVAMPSTFSFRELKNRARGNGGGSDAGIVELLKQLQVGNPISF